MIPAVMLKTFGQWLKSARHDSIDPTTGRHYTQARLAELMNISASKVAAWEREEINSVSPDDAREMARILQRTETEILDAIGYNVEAIPLKTEEKELLAAFRRLRNDPRMQETALRVVRALPGAPA